MIAKQKSEEKYVSLCFAILAEFLSLGKGVDVKSEGGETVTVKNERGEAVSVKSEGGEALESEAVAVKGPVEELPDYCTPEVAELLSDSCLLPAMASYLLNDSGEYCLIMCSLSLSLPTFTCTIKHIHTP